MKILIAEDDRISRLKLQSLLEKWGYQVETCENGSDAWDIAQRQESPNLLILDWLMPGLSGLEICQKLRELAPEPYRYVLLLTSLNEKEDVVQGMQAGADDYICKPFFAHELEVRLRAGRRIVELNQQLCEARNAMQQQATHDSLTGLLNRPAILARLAEELERRRRQKQSLCVGIMDVDHFKQMNDTYGHNVGDQLLQATAQRIQTALRPYDGFGRYGGEEFLIVISDCQCEDLLKHYQRLRKCLADQPLATAAGPVSLTASFGIAIARPEQQIGMEALIGLADKALYLAKEAGRNRIEILTC